jgi:hypothetical protein
VEREVAPGEWETYADQSGEVPVTLRFPSAEDVPAYVEGGHRWPWTAHFEAFVSPFDTGERPRATPPGSYRFVVDGERRSGGQAVPYHVESDPFEVKPWSGITVEGFRLETDGTMSFTVGPRSTYTVGGPASEVDVVGGGPELEAEIGPIDYPDSYESPARFIQNRRTAYRDPHTPGDPSKLEWFCFTCSFRPWIDAGDAESAEVTIVEESTGTVERVAATFSDGRWRTQRTLQPGELAVVESGGVRDPHGNLNGTPSNVLSGGPVPPPPPPPPGDCETLLTGTGDDDSLAGGGASELLLGLDGDDVLRGRAGDDCLFGGNGRDLLRGGPGGDTLEGGAKPDRYEAGTGDDRVFSVGQGREVIDCGPGEDRARVGRVDEVRRCERVRRGR